MASLLPLAFNISNLALVSPNEAFLSITVMIPLKYIFTETSEPSFLESMDPFTVPVTSSNVTFFMPRAPAMVTISAPVLYPSAV